uniref:Prolyl endopeptidase n=1 Tax=Ditylenchus dipsaci TaxID=166011 RepID=A0A915E1G2_9BILA
MQKSNEILPVEYPKVDRVEVEDNIHGRRLTKLWDYEKFGCTSIHGDFYYYNYNSGLQNQWVYYQQQNLGEKWKVFLDVNGLSADGTTSISQKVWSRDGSLFAYGLSEKENIQTTRELSKDLQRRSTVSQSLLPQARNDCKEDVLVADFRENENFLCDGSVTEDGKYLIVEVSDGCGSTNQIYFYDLKAAGNKIEGKLAQTPALVVDNDGESALLLTNHSSPMFKLIRVKMNSDAENPSTWETVIEEDPKRKLEWVAPVAGNKMVVSYLEDVKTTLYVHDLETGKLLYQIPLPIGSVTGFYGRKTRRSSSSVPIQLEEIMKTKIAGLDTEPFDVKQEFYTAKMEPRLRFIFFTVKGNMQNVFNDFASAAQYLIDNKWTSPENLAIRGSNDGGLLVAACSQQRPDLFRSISGYVAFPQIHERGEKISEYGNPDDANDFEFIYKYSPLHNIRLTKDVQWPSTLLMTGDHDDRVSPLHTLKYIAELYHILVTEADKWQKNPWLGELMWANRMTSIPWENDLRDCGHALLPPENFGNGVERLSQST